MEKIKEIDPCKPCLCSGAPCEHCMFGYKQEKERIRLLKEVLKENKYRGIIERYEMSHGKINLDDSKKVTTIDLTQTKKYDPYPIVPATPKFTVLNDGIYIPHDSGALKMFLPRETFVEAYNKYIKGEE